ncbi:carbohydrate ABC transporter permease [Caldilinea sp.]|uniref:carbohydrate ABC transporter permease n=1 Tax=Caldilinea sp. TaxID=2293560 RepID=UPI002BDABEF2|nr:carbohydrate ABC transporter permease [Caldilinea sp.]HRA68882.1 carbohydrate ABC transporter permease [Caldilinea sp.]
MPLRRMQTLINHTLAAAVSLIMFIPIYLVIVNSLKTKAEASSMSAGLPTLLQWENFATVIERGKLVTAFGNSVLYAVGATLIGTTVAALAAYVLSRNRTRFNRFVYFFLIMGIAMPTNFVTLMKVMQMTHLINTQLGIILLYAASSIPFSVFLIYAFISTIPRELDEAAIIDGCNPFRLFFSVIYPLLTPVLVTAGVLNLLGIWNEFLLPLYYLNSSAYWPMTLAVYNFFGQFQADWSLVSADIVLTILPVIIIYLFAQRFILAGMTAGSVKG